MGRCTGALSNADPARVRRMHNDKLRQIGIDKAALDGQVAEKARRLAEEKARDRLYAQQAQEQDRQRLAIEAAEAAARRAASAQVAQYQRSLQGADKARDRDLQPPPGSYQPARLCDDDPRNGPASLQRFEGEDLGIGQRLQQQQAENVHTWTEQHAARAAAEAAAAAADKTVAQLEQAQDEARQLVAAAEEALRRLVAQQTALLNSAAAEARRAALQVEAHDLGLEAAEAAAIEAELEAMARDPYQTEDPNIATSALSSHRVRRDHWKGMSAAQKAAVVAQQAQQAAERKAAQQAAHEEELRHAAAVRQLTADVNEQQRQLDAAKEAQRQLVAAYQKRQAEEAAAREAARNASYHENGPRPEYFDQFETSHR